MGSTDHKTRGTGKAGHGPQKSTKSAKNWSQKKQLAPRPPMIGTDAKCAKKIDDSLFLRNTRRGKKQKLGQQT
jgi:hypothetical protein